MGKPLDPNRKHKVTLDHAAKETKEYRKKGAGKEASSGAFNGDPVMELLKQPGCKGMRIYQGRNELGDASFVLVGVDAEGNDMTDGEVLNTHFPCPPYCSDDDELNT